MSFRIPGKAAANAPRSRRPGRGASGRLSCRAWGASLVGAALALIAATQAPAYGTPRGDWQAGRDVYFRCTVCHALDHNSYGPKHCGLFGRRAGSAKGFSYSDAMEHSKIVWNEQTLDRFLEDPQIAVPGTSMGYTGVKDPKERADLIAFLAQASHSSACREQPRNR